MLSLVEIGSVVLEKKIFKFCQYIFAILLLYVIIFPWKGEILHLNKLESPSPKDALCQVWLKLASRSGGEDYQSLWMYFYYYLSLEKGVVLHLNNFESPSHNSLVEIDQVVQGKLSAQMF